MADVTKKILIDVQLKQNQLKSDITGLNSELDKLLVQQLKLQAQSKQNTAEYVGLTSQIRLAKAEIRDANKQVDNMSKALNAENNSIQQNRALLSVLTAQYVKLGQEEGKTSKNTIELGKTISNLSATLKAQEKQIGQTYREVGNYQEAFEKALSKFGQFIPGLERFNTAITTVVKGFGFLPTGISKSTEASAKFNQTMGYMPQTINNTAGAVENLTVKTGEAAVGTEALAEESGVASESVGAMGVIAVGAAAGVAVLVGGLIAVASYLFQFSTYSDAAAGFMAKFKAEVEGAATSIADGDFEKLGDNIAEAGNQALVATLALKDLQREIMISDVLTESENAKVRNLMLQMRDRATDAVKSEKLFQEALKITATQYERVRHKATEAYKLTVIQETAGYNLTVKQTNALLDLSKGYESVLKYAKQLTDEDVINKNTLEAISNGLKPIIAADAIKANRDQLLQNRNDQKQAKADAAAAKEAALLESIKERTDQANNERIASIARMLEFQQDAFAKEISSTNEHYRQLIFKQEQFISKQRQIARTTKSSKVRVAANGAISAGEADIAQLHNEQYVATEKMLIDHNRLMIQEATKAALELKNLQIANIQDNQKREVAAANNELEIQKNTLNLEKDTLDENIRKIQNELESDSKKKAKDKTKYTDDEIQALKTELNEQLALLGDNQDKRVALIQASNNKINAINKKFYDQETAHNDKSSILDAQAKKGITGGKNNPFNSDEQSAKHQQLLDQYNAEVSVQGLTDAAKLELEKQYLADDKALTEQNEKDKMMMIMDFANQAMGAVFGIIQNGLKAEAQARQVMLSKQKDHELANTSLTSAQKLSIDDKYRKLEGQEKVKEFKQDQKLSLAKAAIATAESILKASPVIPLMALAAATGAVEIAVIASQKPPAYAQGGTFKSDGRGSVLPGYSRHDNVNAQLRSGEAVVVSEAMKDPWARNLVSSINVMYGGKDFSVPHSGRGYAIGGIVTDGGNSNRYYAQPQEGTQNLANSIAFSLINNFPPIYTDVKDINNQQSIRAKTINRVNL